MVRVSLKNTFLSLSFDDDDAEQVLDEDWSPGRRIARERDCSNRSRSADCTWPHPQSHIQQDSADETPRMETHNGTSQIEKLNRLLDTPDMSTADLTEHSEQDDLSHGVDEEMLLSPQFESLEVLQSLSAVPDMYSGLFAQPSFGFNSDPLLFPLWQPLAGNWSGTEDLRASRASSWATGYGGNLQEPVTVVSPARQVPRVVSSPSMSSDDNEDGVARQQDRSSGSVSTMASEHVADEQAGNHVVAESKCTGKQGTKPQSCNGPYPVGPVHQNRQALPRAPGPSKPGPLLKEYRHGHVPKNLNLEEEYRHAHQNMPPTTLMIRNIPNRYTQTELIAELEDLGFGGLFNFLYLPLDKGTMANVGYAFVNFVEHSWAERCMCAFQGYCFKRHRRHSRKVAAVSVAHIQGLEANLLHYETAAVNTAKLKQRRPVVVPSISRQFPKVAVAGGVVQLPPPR